MDISAKPQSMDHKLEVLLETCAAMLDVGMGLRTSNNALAYKQDRLERKLEFFSRSLARANGRGVDAVDTVLLYGFMLMPSCLMLILLFICLAGIFIPSKKLANTDIFILSTKLCGPHRRTIGLVGS